MDGLESFDIQVKNDLIKRDQNVINKFYQVIPNLKEIDIDL